MTIVGMLCAVACTRPAGGGELQTSGATETTSTTAAMTGTTDGTSATTMGTTGMLPDIAGDLPLGCGDGIPVTGQFCFTVLALPDYDHVDRVFGLDLDGDGRDEILVNDSGPPGSLVPLFFDGTTFEPGASVDPLVPTPYFAKTDFDGNGKLDFVELSAGGGFASVFVVLNVEAQLARESAKFALGADSTVVGGFPVVLDTDGDGVPEVLASDENYGSRLFRRQGDDWEAVGPHIDLPGCNIKANAVVGDFDEDGYPDAIVESGWNWCDFGPGSYDAEWNRFGFFRSNPETGLLDLVSTMPTGDRVGTGAFVGDIDGDGHLDAVFAPADGPATIFVRGLGDGTFEPARVIREVEGAESWRLDHLGDFDGDGRLDFSARVDGQLALVMDVATSPAFVVPPIDVTSNQKVWMAADYNGDGVHDFAVEHPNHSNQALLLLSAP